MLFFEEPRFDVTSVAPGDSPATDDPYEKSIAAARDIAGIDLTNPNKEAMDPGHLHELKEAFRKRAKEIADQYPERRKEIELPEFSTLGEVFRSSTETEDLNHSFIGKGLSIERAYDEQIKAVKELTGKDLPNPLSQAADPGHYYELQTEFDKQIEELTSQNPELRQRLGPTRSIDRDSGRIRAGAERREEEVWEKSEKTAADWIARIGGGFYSFLHDPVQIATSAAAPFKAAGAGVKGLLWMGMKQGAANAGAEAALQPFVQQWRKEAGLDYGLSRAATDIGMAGAFGAGLDIGVRSGVRGGRQLAGKPYLGPDAAPSSGGAEPTGARLPGLPEGRQPAGEAPEAIAPRVYRGADPLPPMEALEQAARNAPEGSVLRRAADGDEEALLQLAKETGQDGDPVIKRIIAELETEKIFRDIAPLNVDGGENHANLARAIVGESGGPALPVGDAIVAPIRREIANLADEAVGRALEVEGRPVGFRPIDPRQVITDASTFQFKSGGDVAGVTDRLRGVTRFDPVSAGKAIVFERADGSMVIADGHQRLGLAKRVAAEGQDAKLDAYVFREADGWKPEDVRAYAALKNMRESSGTSVDMAQVMRDRPDLIDGSLPLTDAKLRDAAMLARLSPEAFDAVVAGRLPPPFAALIGESVADAARHRGLLDEMAAADLANTQQARLYLKQLMELPTTTETQMTLFGEESFTRTVLVERAQVLDSALRTLKADKRIFGLLGREADKIESLPSVRDPDRAASLGGRIQDLAGKLSEIESDIRVKMNALGSLASERTQLDAMAERVKGLKSGTFDDRSSLRKAFDRLLMVDPQKMRDLRVKNLEGKAGFVTRVSDQLLADYNRLAAEANGVMGSIEALVAERDSALGKGANVLARDANQAKAESAAQLAELIEKLATSRGTVATILNDAAASVARGLDAKLASRAFVDRIADTLEKEGLPGLVKVDEAPKPDLAPVRMDDPLGPEAKAQADDVNWALELDDEIMFAIQAFHGSPHDFPPVNLIEMPDGTRLYQDMRAMPDLPEGARVLQHYPAGRFDLSKIGTGEGAQVFGHGLYFAEAEGVARSYQLTLGGKGLDVEGVVRERAADLLEIEPRLGNLIYDQAVNGRGPALRDARNVQNLVPGLRDPKITSWDKPGPVQERLAELVDEMRKRNAGNLYEVEIDVEPERLLDWDKPLGEQSEKVKAALEPQIAPIKEKMVADASQWGKPSEQELASYRKQADAAVSRMTVEKLYDALMETRTRIGGSKTDPALQYPIEWRDPESASRALREAGIPGIRYLDQGSRGGDGTRNIVIFDDSLIKITKKNGEPVTAKERQDAVDAMFALPQSPDQPRTPTEVKGFHGTPLGAIERFRSENASKAHDGAFFFTSHSEGTSPYTGEAYLNSPFDSGMQPTVYPTFVETKGFKEIDWKGQNHNDGVGPAGGDLNAEMALAKKEGHPGLVVKNMDEAGGVQDWFITWTPGTVRSALSETQMFALRGFYSPAIRAAESISMKRGTGEQFWKQITKTPNVRKDELEWMGLEEFLAGKKSVTKDEVLEFMRAHQVELDESSFGGKPAEVTEENITSARQAQKLGLEVEHEDLQGLDEAIAVKAKKATVLISKEKGTTFYTVHDPFSDRTISATSRDQAKHIAYGLLQENVTDTRFANFKVPGGENYRELLIRLPALKGGGRNATDAAKLKAIDAQILQLQDDFNRVPGGLLSDEWDAISREIDRLRQEREGIAGVKQLGYKSKHFEDQEIVHLRVDDRTGPNGEKVLFINEVQSDLHQQGRQSGYGAKNIHARAAEARAEIRRVRDEADFRITPEREQELNRIIDEADAMNDETGSAAKIPNAPFKGDLWLELALKRALLYASENGYDAISWARSDQIAKAVGAEPEKLALQYDSKIGKFLDKYTKKWGGKVEQAEIAGLNAPNYRGLSSVAADLIDSHGGDPEAAIRGVDSSPFFAELDAANQEFVKQNLRSAQEQKLKGVNANPILRVTPQMRASVMEGQPLAVKGGQAQATPARNATLHNTTLSARAADEMASIRAEIDNAVAKSLPAGWRAEVRQSLVFGDLSERIQKRNPGVPPSLAIEGTFDPYERIIYVSMAALDPVERAFEEAGHAIKAMRLIPQADYGILQAKALEIGARAKFRIDERYGDVYGARWKDDPARLEEALEEEAIMQMVAARARGDDFGKQSNAIIDKLIKFLRAIRDMLGLKGFRSFEDVFEDMTEGGFARAMDAQRGGAGAGRPIGGEVMAGGPGKTADAAGASITQTPAFRKWFGGSKVVDAEGKPLVVYHGTTANIATFDRRKSRTNKAFFFATDPQFASSSAYTGSAKGGGNVIPAHLSIKKPMVLDDLSYNPMTEAGVIERARGEGYDGIHVLSDGRWIAFDPRQIKSAFNRGTYDPNDPRISFSIRDPESPTATDASFIARAEAASEIMFALGDEGKGKTPEGKSSETKSPETGGEAKPAPERAAAAPSPSAPAKTSAPILPGGRESKRIRNLINQAAAEGKLPREDADALIQRYDALEQFHKDGGKAKQQIAKELTAEAEKRKANKELAELKRRIIVGFLVGVRDARGQADPAKAYQALIENLGQLELPQGFVDVAGHQRAIYGMALAELDAMLHEFKGVDFSPSGVKVALTGATRNKARLANVVRELHGEATGDELAAGFAQAAAKVMEDLRFRFNAAGGSIAKRKDWAMPQSHDKVALLKAKKEAWVDFITPLLDQKWMKHPLTGDDMPPADVRKTLGDVYDNLVADGWHEREAEMVKRGLSAISNTRADPRSLIFKDADAWMKYSARFGSGDDALAIIISHIRGMTKDIAAMEVLGPNPTAMLEYIRQFVVQQASLRRAGMTAVFPTHREITGIEFKPGSKFLDPVGYANAMTKRAENMWRIYTGAASAPESPGWAEVSTTVKNINVATKLGGAFVSGLGDPFWQIAARKFAGLPAVKMFPEILNQIKAGGEREARRSGVIAETFLHMHNEGAREGAAWSASKVSGYLADRVLTLSMLSSLTRAGNHAMSMGIQSHLADMAAKAFPDLDPRLQRMFRRWGLEATDWDAIRLDAAGRARDVDFLSPADIRRQLVDNGGDPAIAERYLAMTLGEAQYATLTGTITAQARVYGNMQAGTAQREMWSMFMQFKSFAVNLAILQISRMAREFVSQGFSRGAQYAFLAVGMATLGGALVEQFQQLRNGKDPRAMTTVEFWVSALYRSGGLSIWGDLLYASENRFGGGVASTFAGPTAGTLNDLLNLTYGSAKKSLLFTDDQQKTNFGRQLSSAISRYTPGSSIWYLRTAWERVAMDNLQRMLDPEAEASLRRKIQNAKRDYKQDFWWKPGGGAIPQRGPRLGAAFPAR